MERGKKRVVVVLNGISLNKKIFYRKILPALAEVAEVEVHETLSRNDAVSQASKACDQFADAIFAAGGDGTLHQVLNGVFKGRETFSKLPSVGVIPLGTGNDFARTTNITSKPAQLAKLVSDFKPKKVDIGRIDYTLDSGERSFAYFVNVADLGMGPEVVKKVMNRGRVFGRALAYYRSILSTFISYRPVNVSASTAEWTWNGRLRTLGICNGKCYGHGLYIAPDAILDDRLFNVFICGNVSVLDFIRFTLHLRKARHIGLSEVHYKSTTEISLLSEQPCLIEGDGELLGYLPATVRLCDRQLDFLV